MESKKLNKLDSYVFNSVNDIATSNYIYLKSIGYENHVHNQETPYFCNWSENNIEEARELTCIIQYTISGEGVVEIGDKQYKQTAGEMFMVERPGEYKYWLPEGSEHWELKFIEFSATALPIWNTITQSFGRTFSMKETNDVMDLWNEIFDKTKKMQIVNFFDNAGYAYKFLLSMHKYLTEFGVKSPNYDSIQKCMDYIKENYSKNLTLTDIAEAGGLSPFYVNKSFKTILGDTPVRYLVKVRVRRAMDLLYNSNMSIDAIAEQCGFKNANYFAKVFRKYVNMSPTDFRNQKLMAIIL